MSETQALIDLSQELSETQRILTNVQMDRDAYSQYTLYLLGLLHDQIMMNAVISFTEFLVSENIPHASRH